MATPTSTKSDKSTPPSLNTFFSTNQPTTPRIVHSNFNNTWNYQMSNQNPYFQDSNSFHQFSLNPPSFDPNVSPFIPSSNKYQPTKENHNENNIQEQFSVQEQKSEKEEKSHTPIKTGKTSKTGNTGNLGIFSNIVSAAKKTFTSPTKKVLIPSKNQQSLDLLHNTNESNNINQPNDIKSDETDNLDNGINNLDQNKERLRLQKMDLPQIIKLSLDPKFTIKISDKNANQLQLTLSQYNPSTLLHYININPSLYDFLDNNTRKLVYSHVQSKNPYQNPPIKSQMFDPLELNYVNPNYIITDDQQYNHQPHISNQQVQFQQQQLQQQLQSPTQQNLATTTQQQHQIQQLTIIIKST